MCLLPLAVFRLRSHLAGISPLVSSFFPGSSVFCVLVPIGCRIEHVYPLLPCRRSATAGSAKAGSFLCPVGSGRANLNFTIGLSAFLPPPRRERGVPTQSSQPCQQAQNQFEFHLRRTLQCNVMFKGELGIALFGRNVNANAFHGKKDKSLDQIQIKSINQTQTCECSCSRSFFPLYSPNGSSDPWGLHPPGGHRNQTFHRKKGAKTPAKNRRRSNH